MDAPLTTAAVPPRPGRRPTDHAPTPGTGRLLTVDQAAEFLNTSTRFVRRLIAERRIPFHKLGRHVRLAEADLSAFVAAGRVEPTTPADVWHDLRAVA